MSTNPSDPTFCQNYNGLTKREHFAALAMQGFTASPDYSAAHCDKIAKYAVEQADALIAALNEAQP